MVILVRRKTSARSLTTGPSQNTDHWFSSTRLLRGALPLWRVLSARVLHSGLCGEQFGLWRAARRGTNHRNSQRNTHGVLLCAVVVLHQPIDLLVCPPCCGGRAGSGGGGALRQVWWTAAQQLREPGAGLRTVFFVNPSVPVSFIIPSSRTA